MFVQLRKMTVKEGTAQLVIDRFSKPGIIEEQKGFAGIQVMQKETRRGEEEVVILVSWESKEDWKQWEKSDAHIAGHKAKRNQPKPDHILNVEVGMYEVKAAKSPARTQG